MCSMDAVGRQVSVRHLKIHSGLLSTYEPIPIETEGERLVESAHKLPRFARPKRAWLDNIVGERQVHSFGHALDIAAVRFGLALNEVKAIAKQKLRFFLIQLGCYKFQGA